MRVLPSALRTMPSLTNAKESGEVAYGGIGLVKLTSQIGAAELLHGEPHGRAHFALEESLVLLGRHLDNRRPP